MRRSRSERGTSKQAGWQTRSGGRGWRRRGGEPKRARDSGRLPLACHFRIAAKEGAQIGLPELDLGSVPAWGGSARLPRAVGRTYALDMILRGRKIDGAEAYRIGLVTELVQVGEIKARAQAIGEDLAAQPRQAVRSMLEVVVGHETKPLAQSLEDEMAAVAANRGTKDSQEGMRAFMEKRTPVFNQV